MNILFLSYWGINDPLTVSTVFPHLQILQDMPQVNSILLVTIERSTSDSHSLGFSPDFSVHAIRFQPLLSKLNQPLLFNKLDDFLRFPRELRAMVQQHSIDAIIARGAPAGALAYLVWKKTKLPFLVESFEPHADYMLESGVWKRYDPRFIFEEYWEGKQKQLATGIMPVAENYRRKLMEQGVAAQRIRTVPCSVSFDKFRFDDAQRQRMRRQLQLSEQAIVGIYVGKFGGMYYEEEAFELFQAAARFFGQHFRLLILTPIAPDVVQQYLVAAGFDLAQVFVTKAPPAEVPTYLSAADFAFATYKKGEAKQYLSPIKVGEYWAAGLPVLLTEGVGDDSAIIQQQGGGAIFDVDQPATVQAALQRIAVLMQAPDHRNTIQQLARQYRSIDRAREAYQQLLLPLVKG